MTFNPPARLFCRQYDQLPASRGWIVDNGHCMVFSFLSQPLLDRWSGPVYCTWLSICMTCEHQKFWNCLPLLCNMFFAAYFKICPACTYSAFRDIFLLWCACISLGLMPSSSFFAVISCYFFNSFQLSSRLFIFSRRKIVGQSIQANRSATWLNAFGNANILPC